MRTVAKACLAILLGALVHKTMPHCHHVDAKAVFDGAIITTSSDTDWRATDSKCELDLSST